MQAPFGTRANQYNIDFGSYFKVCIWMCYKGSLNPLNDHLLFNTVPLQWSQLWSTGMKDLINFTADHEPDSNLLNRCWIPLQGNYEWVMAYHRCILDGRWWGGNSTLLYFMYLYLLVCLWSAYSNFIIIMFWLQKGFLF